MYRCGHISVTLVKLAPHGTETDCGCSGVNLLGILGDGGADSKGLAGKRGRMWEEYPRHRGGLGQGQLLPRKIFFPFKWHVLLYSEQYLVCTFARKMLNFPLEVMVWSVLVYVADVLREVLNAYTRSILILEILKRDKIWGGQFALASPTPDSGLTIPPVPRDLGPCTVYDGLVPRGTQNVASQTADDDDDNDDLFVGQKRSSRHRMRRATSPAAGACELMGISRRHAGTIRYLSAASSLRINIACSTGDTRRAESFPPLTAIVL